MSAPGVGGAHDEGFGPGNVSRSGRVRKKNSLLAGYESLDALDKPKRKAEKTPKSKEKSNASPKVTLKIGGETPKRTPKKPPVKRVKMDSAETKEKIDSKSRIAAMRMEMEDDDDDDDEGDLEIDLPPEFEEEIPLIAAEEIIDETLLDEEDGATEIAEHTSINRLKSQAESTYMMEKTLEKIRKATNQNAGPGKAKNTRKDKGNPRITAYMIWAKEQRTTFAKKYPHLDFSAVSKKLGELWATVPQNQKKMWKNRAAKMMRKNAHVMENMKNSGVSPGSGNNVKTTSKKLSTPAKAKIVKTTGKDPIKNETSSPAGQKSPVKGNRTIPGGGGGKKTNAVVKAGAKLENGNKKTISPPSKGGAKGKSKPGVGTSSSSGINFSSEFTHQTTVHIKNDKKTSSKNVSNHTSISSLVNTVNVSTMQTVTSRNSPGSPSSKTQYSPRKDDDVALYKVTGTTPIDVGAHFSLLGESLSIIGERLKDVEGQTVSGSLSVLLDSLLCATGPLLCLTQQIPELNSIPQEELAKLLDNIAYVMPGL